METQSLAENWQRMSSPITFIPVISDTRQNVLPAGSAARSGGFTVGEGRAWRAIHDADAEIR